MKPVLTVLISAFLLSPCYSNGQNKAISNINSITTEQKIGDSIVYQSEALVIRKVANHVYEHTSFLTTNSYGKVPCNGMIVVDHHEAVIFDTPADGASSKELIAYFTNKMGIKICAVIATHFHKDCVGGIKEFHKSGIPSYARSQTISLLKRLKSELIPQNGFDKEFKLKVGDRYVYAAYLGEGHTRDNIIGYFPDEQVMFGGCLIKEYGANKGNLEDANTIAWPETVRKLKAKYPQTKTVIPGHGKSGGIELLDYTIQLFE